MENILSDTDLVMDSDCYKYSHFQQYPPGTEKVYSYLESRGGLFKETVFFGLQYILKRYFSNPITREDVDEAYEYARLAKLPFHKEGWDHIVNKHGGYLPVIIKAPHEGSVIPVHNVLMTIENTDPRCLWLTNFLETQLLRVWYPITVATKSYYSKKLITKFLRDTADNTIAEYKLHDFGSRGVSCREQAGIGGLAHLTSFYGTDTFIALKYGKIYYNEPCAGESIPATEHSTMTSWGKDREKDAYENAIKVYLYGGYSLLSIVADSYDIYNAAEHIFGEELKDLIVNSNGTLVIRPDSGDPVRIVTELAEILDSKFGSKLNNKGYKVLNHVRIIQGDGIDFKDMINILNTLTVAGYSAENVTFGMGGGLLQRVNRDTQKFAIKCSAINIDGKWQDVYKDPVTDSGKTSKRGKQDLVYHNGMYETIKDDVTRPRLKSELITYYDNGTIFCDYTLNEIRGRIDKHLNSDSLVTVL